MSEVAAPDFTYRIELNGSVPSQITVRMGRTKPKTLVTLPRPAEDVSLVPAIATAILEHHFQATAQQTSEASAAERAHRYRKALSRVISARLTRATKAATLRTADIANSILKYVISPPVDHWIERYTVPSESSDRKYTVGKKDDGTWGCTCPRYKFHHVECKHIQAVQAHPGWYPHCPEDG